MIFIILFILLICICFAFSWNILGSIFLLISAGYGIVKIIAIQEEDENNIEKEKQKIKEQEDEESKASIIPAYTKARAELINKYGKPTKEFILEQYNLEKEIIAFEESNRIWILGRDFSMKSILSCTYVDVELIVKEQQYTNINMLQLPIVGNVVFGGIDSILCGATSDNSTICTQEDADIHHDYSVVINVDSLSEPIIRISLGDKAKKVNDIIALMNVIIKRGKNM